VTNAPIADVAVVFATPIPVNVPDHGFIVEKGMPVFSISRHIDKMGLRTFQWRK
jgi:alkylation response protein AidB-like acyl-CoA dehydrogenase